MPLRGAELGTFYGIVLRPLAAWHTSHLCYIRAMPVPQTEVLITVDGVEHARHILTPGDYVIGRNPDCHLRVDADLVSRQHAKLFLNFDNALIEDLGSSNGTFVNDVPIPEGERTRLWPSQKIRIGAATIELHRLQMGTPGDMSLAPAQQTLRDMLPAEMLREKKYDIGAVVARGGMGAILDAREAAIERRVAMKVMLDTNDAGDIARFIAEAKVTGQLEHPNIVPVHELGVDENGQPFYTMQMVRGITLKKVLELLADGVAETVKKFPLSALLTVFQKVCDAIAFAHSRGVIHRDLKPENLMLGDFGSVLVMDWGLAKIIGKQDRTGAAPSMRSSIHLAGSGAASSALGSTQAGTIMGTPQYMPPEQARGEIETLDQRADIYSLGAILYHILTLRPPVSGADAMEVIAKVARGEIEPLIAPGDVAQRRKDAKKDKGSGKPAEIQNSKFKTQNFSHLPGGRIPDSLAAVVRKAMSFDKAARYACTEDLQADILAYQNGFATSAEKAGAWKQFTLLVKRHKAASIGLAAVLLIGGTLGTKAILEGRRAEREAIISKRALADLKASAPALLQLAESEADSQRFASALGKLDAALALDPALRRARWQRAWVLLALERWSEAADALRLARPHDPAGAPLASILPAVEKVAAAPEAERWKSEAAREVFAHLQSVEATGPAIVLAGKLKLNAEERRKLTDQRLLAALGKGNYIISVSKDGLVTVEVSRRPLRSLEALRGLQIDGLTAGETLIADIDPLRGMRLQTLYLHKTKVADLAPLRGMTLRALNIESTPVSDLTPLIGMPLQFLNINNTQITDLSPLAGLPLTELLLAAKGIVNLDSLRGLPLVRLSFNGNRNLLDCSPLKGAPLQDLNMSSTSVSDLTFLEEMPLRILDLHLTPVVNLAALRGLPLEILDLDRTSITDISPLQGAPLKDLNLRFCPKLKDYTPVLTLPRLERLHCDVLPAALLPLRESATLQSIEADAYPGEGSQGARPVAEFWHAYDAWKAKQPK